MVLLFYYTHSGTGRIARGRQMSFTYPQLEVVERFPIDDIQICQHSESKIHQRYEVLCAMYPILETIIFYVHWLIYMMYIYYTYLLFRFKRMIN